MAKKKRGSARKKQEVHEESSNSTDGEENNGEVEQRSYSHSTQENPGLVITSITLTGSNNYLSRKNSLIRALTAKDKLQYALDVKPDLEEETNEFRKWKKNDCLVTSWILNTISKDLTEGFSYVRSANELWKALDHFCESNGPLLFKLKRDISLFEQGDLSILQYFNKLCKMWDELLLLRPIVSYKCGGAKECSCNVFGKIAEQELPSSRMDNRYSVGSVGISPIPRIRLNISSLD